MSFSSIQSLLYIDMLSIIMMSLVSFIGITVGSFSRRYMKGDSLYNIFYMRIFIVLFSIILLTIADNLLLFLTAWLCSNFVLTQLIVHKSTWKAAQASGKIAHQNFIVGFCCIAISFFLLYKATGSFSIQYILHNQTDSLCVFIALIMLIIGALRQSAIWPFHRWLISSLNSPTPVSALMHAGIVNGGGFILIRFAPLYLYTPELLHIIFIFGLISALLGSFWKLIQHDVKSMLACSTIGQMGFMFVQLGLGLFASALAHIFWHGIFKAYLFFSSSSAAQEKKNDIYVVPGFICFLLSLACGILGVYIFSSIHSSSLFPLDTSLIIVGIVFVACTQLALTILQAGSLNKFPLAIFITSIMATLYGVNVYFFDLILSPLELMQPQSLTIFHIIGFIILLFSWFLTLCIKSLHTKPALPDLFLYLYVKALNSSQPHPITVTTSRKGYDYV